MNQYFLDAEGQRRVALALSIREQTGRKLGTMGREIWTLLTHSFRSASAPQPTH